MRAMRSSVRPNTDRVVSDAIPTPHCRYRLLGLTDQALPVFRVPIEVFAVGHHASSQMGNREGLLFVVSLIAFRDGLDIRGHGFMNAVNA